MEYLKLLQGTNVSCLLLIAMVLVPTKYRRQAAERERLKF